MKISIITATKNNKSGLLRAIESVRIQTYKNVEHIIVDGGSTDGTVEAINNEQLTMLNDQCSMYNVQFISELDNGIYDAINKGIKLASGDVIGLLHSDDFYTDEYVLEKVLQAFQDIGLEEKDKSFFGVEAVYSDLVYVRSKAKDEKRKKSVSESNEYFALSTEHSVIRKWKTQNEEFTTETQRHREILKGWMPPHPTLFLRRTVFENYGLYRTDMKIAADYEMILRLFFKSEVTSFYLPVTTYCMTIGGVSNKSLKNILRKSSEDYYAMKLHGIPFPLKTLLLKNFRKLPQFFNKSK
ncbi:glycosyltransferase family 2 protein [Ignavibacterium sp.]|uniref:glycosyltransferase family 2 protein n=1 Tax=Ignavibacterium sp. TaxID=2651167 RepID=UPI00307E2AF3